MSWTLDGLKQRRDEILEMARRGGALRVRIFGSIARGDAGPESDVDFVVDFAPGTSLLDHGGLIMDLQEALDCKVDVISERGMRDRLRKQVEADAVAL